LDKIVFWHCCCCYTNAEWDVYSCTLTCVIIVVSQMPNSVCIHAHWLMLYACFQCLTTWSWNFPPCYDHGSLLICVFLSWPPQLSVWTIVWGYVRWQIGFYEIDLLAIMLLHPKDRTQICALLINIIYSMKEEFWWSVYIDDYQKNSQHTWVIYAWLIHGFDMYIKACIHSIMQWIL